MMKYLSTRRRSLPSSVLWSLACLTVAATACSDALGPHEDDLVAARASWAEADADDYRFEFQRFCFCDPNSVRLTRIEVSGGTVSSAIYLDVGEPVTGLSSLPTIESLFDEIEAAIDGEAYLLMADYNPAMGYPTDVPIDFIENAIDDEMSFSVSAFQLLDGSGL